MSNTQATTAATPERAKPVFGMLDGFRGVGCLIVVACHAIPYVTPILFFSGYIAVDAFFLMSGFVIANAYRERILSGTMPVAEFIRVRAIRLYPLFLLGVLVGVPALFLVWAHENRPDVSLAGWLSTIFLNALMLPRLSNAFIALVPLNVPGWSLTLEFLVNLAYGVLLKILKNALLIALVAASGIGLVWQIAQFGHSNLGSEASTALGGIFRVGYSFFLGVMIYRVRAGLLLRDNIVGRAYRAIDKIRIHPWMLLAIMVAILEFNAPHAWRPLWDALGVFVIMPFFIVLCLNSEPRGMSAKVFTFLGRISFAVYALHYSVIRLFRVYFPADGGLHDGRSIAIVAAMYAIILCLAWLATDYFDAPARALISKKTKPLTRFFTRRAA